ncbi:MAG: hypothetical protein HYY04_09925 [Chloroflexi bacterium]|nr:hypothetical protein [Chloroflexota bacterium]
MERRPGLGAPLRLGLIADTHDADDAAASIGALAGVSADLYVHLGDVGTAPIVVDLVRTFKTDPRWEEHLEPAERERYRAMVSQGTRPVLAYIDVRIGQDPALRQLRYTQTVESYTAAARCLARLGQVTVVVGNVDRAWLRDAEIRRVLQRPEIRLVEWPEVMPVGDRALLLWPSLRAHEANCQQLEAELPALRTALAPARQVIVCAHEQTFRGPSPARYQANLRRRGLIPRTVPAFAPNPTRHLLVRLLRTLADDLPVAIASGHIHDAPEVVAIGTGYLRRLPSGGLGYRLFGGGQYRRLVELFPVPSDRPAVLHCDEADERGFRFELREVSG